LFHTFPTALIWHHLTSGCSEISRNISKAIVSHVMKNFKPLQQNGFENSLKNSTATGLKNLFSAGGVSIVRGTMWKREV
jgi:hypothetical protein